MRTLQLVIKPFLDLWIEHSRTLRLSSLELISREEEWQAMRNFVSALERPRVVLWLSIAGIGLNALLSWSLIFGHFGLPALGLRGGGIGSSI